MVNTICQGATTRRDLSQTWENNKLPSQLPGPWSQQPPPSNTQASLAVRIRRNEIEKELKAVKPMSNKDQRQQNFPLPWKIPQTTKIWPEKKQTTRTCCHSCLVLKLWEIFNVLKITIPGLLPFLFPIPTSSTPTWQGHWSMIIKHVKTHLWYFQGNRNCRNSCRCLAKHSCSSGLFVDNRLAFTFPFLRLIPFWERVHQSDLSQMYFLNYIFDYPLKFAQSLPCPHGKVASWKPEHYYLQDGARIEVWLKT